MYEGCGEGEVIRRGPSGVGAHLASTLVAHDLVCAPVTENKRTGRDDTEDW